VIVHLQSNLPDSPSLLLSLLLLLFSFYAAEKSLSSPATTTTAAQPLVTEISSSFLVYSSAFLVTLRNLPTYLIAYPIPTIIRRHHTTSPQSIKSSRHAKRSHQQLFPCKHKSRSSRHGQNDLISTTYHLIRDDQRLNNLISGYIPLC